MAELTNLVVVSVDRDNDLGRKANIKGPVIGRKNNLNAAAKLGLADPGDSDVNCLFGAIKKFDELKKQFEKVEIITLTGKGKQGFESDREINRQLDLIMKKIKADAFVLVTDGAEDDQVIPILQSRARIFSKQMIIVKQAKEVESVFYTIKEALKDPFISRIAFGVPGIILLLYFLLGSMSFQIISLVVGAYLLLKGFGIEEWAFSTVHNVTKHISLQRTSFPFYIAVLFLFAFGLISSYTVFSLNAGQELLIQATEAVGPIITFGALAAIAFLIGKSIDVIHLRKAFLLRTYFLYGIFVLVMLFIIDSGRGVLTGRSDFNSFLLNTLLSFVVSMIAFQASKVMDVRKKITKLLVGLPVYNSSGEWLGKVEKINKKEHFIEFAENGSRKTRIARRPNFTLKEGKIILSS